MMIALVLVCICLAFLFHLVFLKPHNYWRDHGVKCEKPSLIFGHLGPVVLQKCSIAVLLKNFYDKCNKERFVALYQFYQPTLLIKDLDLIRQIFIKEFDSFPEHKSFASRESDPIWSNTLFAMEGGQKWRDIRSILSPAFTTNKLKTMFSLIVDCAHQLVDYFDNDNLITLEIKEVFSKVTNDLIATTAFGVSCDSLKNPNNEMFLTGTNATMFSGFLMKIKFFAASVTPALAKYLRIRFIKEENSAFFRKIIMETISFREKNGIIRPDMLHLMLEARKGKLKNDDVVHGENDLELETAKKNRTILSDDVIIAQAVNFYFAGFDTVSTAMSYTAYELAVQPEIQNRLYDEIKQTLEKCNGQLTYESLLGMKYLDMVISESLRKWPPFAVSDRKAVKPFTVISGDGEKIHLDDNVICQIPIYAIHRDPNYYPQPEKFDPERFNDENKSNIPSLAYIPFGVGPRNCIGNRFGLLVIKTVMFYLIHKFEVLPVEKTTIPLKLSNTNVNPVPEDGYWLGLKARKSMK